MESEPPYDRVTAAEEVQPQSIRVLALASYPLEAASTRYRVSQFIEPLAEQGITLTVHPFLDSRLLASLYKRGQWPRTALGLVRAALRRVGIVWRAPPAEGF